MRLITRFAWFPLFCPTHLRWYWLQHVYVTQRLDYRTGYWNILRIDTDYPAYT